jgi:hypothetical protein
MKCADSADMECAGADGALACRGTALPTVRLAHRKQSRNNIRNIAAAAALERHRHL